MSIPPTKIPIGGVLIRDVKTGADLVRLESWPNPFPVVGDVVKDNGVWGRVKERVFKCYGRAWGVTIWIDTEDKGYEYQRSVFLVEENTNATP